MMPWPTKCSRLGDSDTKMGDLVAIYKSCKIESFRVSYHEDVFYRAGCGTENKEGSSSRFRVIFVERVHHTEFLSKKSDLEENKKQQGITMAHSAIFGRLSLKISLNCYMQRKGQVQASSRRGRPLKVLCATKLNFLISLHFAFFPEVFPREPLFQGLA